MQGLLYAITVYGLLLSGPLVDVVSASEPETLGQLKERLATLPAMDAAQRVKRAVLELALERSRNASAVGLKAEAHALELDVRGGLARPAAEFSARNPDADHLSILKPLLTKRNNPYLDAMVQAAREELAKPDTVWPRATAAKPTFSRLGGEFGVRSAGTTMREYFWLFAHSESPMRGDPELLKRALRRAHAYIDGLNLYAGYYAQGLGWDPMGLLKELFESLKHMYVKVKCLDKSSFSILLRRESIFGVGKEYLVGSNEFGTWLQRDQNIMRMNFSCENLKKIIKGIRLGSRLTSKADNNQTYDEFEKYLEENNAGIVGQGTVFGFGRATKKANPKLIELVNYFEGVHFNNQVYANKHPALDKLMQDSVGYTSLFKTAEVARLNFIATYLNTEYYFRCDLGPRCENNCCCPKQAAMKVIE